MEMSGSATAQKPNNMTGALMIAALAGVAAGVLFAPKKGSETRADIKNKVEEAKVKSREQAAMAQERAQKMAQTAKEKAHDMMEAAKGKAEEVQDNAQGKVEDARKQVDDLASDNASRNHRQPPTKV